MASSNLFSSMAFCTSFVLKKTERRLGGVCGTHRRHLMRRTCPRLRGSGHCHGRQPGGLTETAWGPLAWPLGPPRPSSLVLSPRSPIEAHLAPGPQPMPSPPSSTASDITAGNSSKRSVHMPTPRPARGPQTCGSGPASRTQPLSLGALTSHAPFLWPLLCPHQMSPHRLPELTHSSSLPPSPQMRPAPQCARWVHSHWLREAK